MAGIAFLPVSASVFVLHRMTGNAGRTDALIFFAGVTCRTCDFAVHTNQRKLGLIVIERLGRSPAFIAMAILAHHAETTFVRLNCAMAVDANAWRLAKFFLRLMTPITSRRRVSAGQLEISARMVERFAIELHDIEFPPLVIRMAVLAIPRHGIAVAPMKSTRLGAISGHVFMAV